MSAHIVVVGAGIIGASIAYHLARDGARVTVLDAGEPGGLATRASWAWINASWGNPEFYFHFRRRSMAEWRRLAGEIPALDVRWSGGLCWDLPAQELEAYARQHSFWGYGIRRVTRAEALEIEPNLAAPPDFAVHVAEEGVVEPLAAAQALLAAAGDRGAAIRGHVHVKRLLIGEGRVTGVETEQGAVEADHVVLAAGAGVPPLAASVGVHVPLTAPPGLLIHTKPAPKCLNGLVMSPELHVRQTPEGRLVVGSDFVGAEPGQHPERTAADLFARLQAFLNNTALTLDFHRIGYRPTPPDSYPIVGPSPNIANLYITVMHSGITNAAAVGLLASQEILKNQSLAELSSFRFERFARG